MTAQTRRCIATPAMLASVFTYGNDEIIVAGIGIRDGLGWTLKPPPQEIDKPVEITQLKDCDCGFESHRTLPYANTLVQS